MKHDDTTPLDRLLASALTAAIDTVTDIFDQAEAENDSAKLLLAAMQAVVKIDQTEYTSVHILPPGEAPPAGLEATLTIYATFQPPAPEQVDVAIHAYDHTGRIIGAPGWRRTIIEIDLAATAAAELPASHLGRGKRGMSVPVMRLTASEISRDPWLCARRIVDWASQGFGF